MSDEHPTQPLPDSGARWVLSTDAGAPAPRKRRRFVPWMIALIVIAALAVGAWFAGEAIARGIVERTIREQVTSNLQLPADQPLDIEVPGAILPQLISGRLDQVTVSGTDLPLHGLTGDVVARATGIPVRGDAPATSASATVTLDEQQLQALLSSLDGFPATTVTLAEPDVDVSMELQVLSMGIPVGVGLTPSAVAGQLVLSPETLRVWGAEVPAEALVDQFGAVARTVVRDWEVCVAQYLPAGLKLAQVRVQGATVVADFDIDGAIITDTALQQLGTCD